MLLFVCCPHLYVWKSFTSLQTVEEVVPEPVVVEVEVNLRENLTWPDWLFCCSAWREGRFYFIPGFFLLNIPFSYFFFCGVLVHLAFLSSFQSLCRWRRGKQLNDLADINCSNYWGFSSFHSMMSSLLTQWRRLTPPRPPLWRRTWSHRRQLPCRKRRNLQQSPPSFPSSSPRY